ncbi:MAG: prolyl oligopeptidase family serine peptidase [Burkholderiales bacterium]|nr:prolyl oligopeptidase family serine peptidase [Burkholderiales bacterium]
MKPLRWLVPLVVTVAVAQEGDDPFRFLENLSAPESQSFYREQATRARATLDVIPGRPAMLERIRALSESAPVVTRVKLAGKRVFYLKLTPRQSTAVLYVREGLAGAERVVLDPERFSHGPVRASIDWYAPSPDGRHVAYGVSLGGGEDSVLRVLAVDAGRDLPVEIDRTRFNADLAWHPDSRSFYYARVPEGNQGARRYANIRLYHHVLGRPAIRDEIVFASGVGGARDVPEFVYPSLHLPLESPFAYAIAREGVRREIAVHVAEQGDLAKGRPRWRKLVGYEDGVTAIEGWKEDLLLLTHRGAPNLHVVRMKATAAIGTARPAVPEGDAVIQEMALARDAIYLRTSVGGVDRLEKTPTGLFGSRTRQFVRLPFDNAISELIADPRTAGVVVRLQGWIEPPAILQVDVKGDLHRTALQPPPVADFSGMDEVRLYTRSHDGASIPVTLVYKKTTTLNGANPTILVAFGSYGMTLAPTFDPALLAWLERGGVYAIAHVRGGGEHGLAWHMAGMRAQKVNTVLDFIAVAEFISAYGFTSPAKLAAMGTGAGAIPVGGAAMRRPELFAAAILRSPMTDLVRLEFTPNGPANIPEFGTSTSPAGAAMLRVISPLHQVKDAMPYPAVLLTAAANDPWISLSQPGKMAARLQAGNPGGKPVLLRIDDAAHAGRTRTQHDEDLADIFSFALWQFERAPVAPALPEPHPVTPAQAGAQSPSGTQSASEAPTQ